MPAGHRITGRGVVWDRKLVTSPVAGQVKQNRDSAGPGTSVCSLKLCGFPHEGQTTSLYKLGMGHLTMGQSLGETLESAGESDR
jgi:hypothetical protein